MRGKCMIRGCRLLKFRRTFARSTPSISREARTEIRLSLLSGFGKGAGCSFDSRVPVESRHVGAAAFGAVCRVSTARSRHPRFRERAVETLQDRKSTRLNSSHLVISYAVFCLKKKKNNNTLCESVMQ